MHNRLRPFHFILLPVAAACAMPAFAQTGPTCASLATNAGWGLAANGQITGLTAVVTAATSTNAAYCQVDFTDVSLNGRPYGYLPGQTSKMRIRVGLPLSTADGGTGRVQGAWN